MVIKKMVKVKTDLSTIMQRASRKTMYLNEAVRRMVIISNSKPIRKARSWCLLIHINNTEEKSIRLKRIL